MDVRCDPRARWTEDLYEDLPPGDRRLMINNSYGARQPYGRFSHWSCLICFQSESRSLEVYTAGVKILMRQSIEERQLSIQVILEVEADISQRLNDNRAFKDQLAKLIRGLARCQPPLTTDMLLRYVPSIPQQPSSSSRNEAGLRAGGFEVLHHSLSTQHLSIIWCSCM